MALDGPTGSERDAVHILFAGERVRKDDVLPSPDLSESAREERFQVVSLEALIRMKLMAWGDQDRAHVRDLIDGGLVDRTWCERFPAVLAERLRMLLDTPGG